MKGTYKGCEIEVTKEKSLAGYKMLFYNIFDVSNGLEVTSGYSEGGDKVVEFYESLKEVVDDYKDHPADYE
jgi:hypothetical protein